MLVSQGSLRDTTLNVLTSWNSQNRDTDMTGQVQTENNTNRKFNLTRRKDGEFFKNPIQWNYS